MLRKSNKRDEIIRSALELIAEHGFHGAPMAMIAERAEVGAGTIYRYFENKEILINELYREIEEHISTNLRAGYKPDSPIRERFLHVCAKLLRYFIDNTLHFRYLEQFNNSPYAAKIHQDMFLGKIGGCNVFLELFDEGVSLQVLKDLPWATFLALAVGPLIMLAREHVLGFIILDDALISRAMEACWEGIRR